MRLNLGLLFVFILAEANITNVLRKNVLLSRRKRYLTFPEGSNFVITLSLTKRLLNVQPEGWNVVLEVDYPFILPFDTRLFKQIKSQTIQRRDLVNHLEAALTRNNLNGSACVKRMLCDIQPFKNTKGKSLAQDIIYATFSYPEEELFTSNGNECQLASINCPLPIVDYTIGSLGY